MRQQKNLPSYLAPYDVPVQLFYTDEEVGCAVAARTNGRVERYHSTFDLRAWDGWSGHVHNSCRKRVDSAATRFVNLKCA